MAFAQHNFEGFFRTPQSFQCHILYLKTTYFRYAKRSGQNGAFYWHLRNTISRGFFVHLNPSAATRPPDR
jgi:hypothetical protein